MNLNLTHYFYGKNIPVLCYHQVRPKSGMTPEKFGRHLDWIQKFGFETISVIDLYDFYIKKKHIHKPYVAITFDDCTIDNWLYAIPELYRRNMKASFFAITDFIKEGRVRKISTAITKNQNDLSFESIMKNAIAGKFEGFMNTEEVTQASAKYGMEIYSHTASHQSCFTKKEHSNTSRKQNHWSYDSLKGNLNEKEILNHKIGSAYAFSGFGNDWNDNPLNTATPDNRFIFCLNEFSRSKIFLEKLLHKPCQFLCLPWGQYDDITLNAAKKAGYSAVLTLDNFNFLNFKSNNIINRIGRFPIKDKKSIFKIMTKILFKTYVK